MRFSISKMLTKYTAKVALSGTRKVARTAKRTQRQRDAERDAAEGEKEFWEAILRQDAEDQRREFHRYNAEWALEVQKYEEEVMKKQDQELKELNEKAEQEMQQSEDKEEQKQQRKQEHVKVMREMAYMLLTENSGLEDPQDYECSESSVDSFVLPPLPVPGSLQDLSCDPGPMVIVCHDIPAALAKMAADDAILQAQLGRPVFIPWWDDSTKV